MRQKKKKKTKIPSHPPSSCSHPPKSHLHSFFPNFSASFPCPDSQGYMGGYDQSITAPFCCSSLLTLFPFLHLPTGYSSSGEPAYSAWTPPWATAWIPALPCCPPWAGGKPCSNTASSKASTTGQPLLRCLGHLLSSSSPCQDLATNPTHYTKQDQLQKG